MELGTKPKDKSHLTEQNEGPNVVTNYNGTDSVPRGVTTNTQAWWMRDVAALNGYPWPG